MDPAGIISTTLFATLCSTAAAIIAAKVYQRFSKADPETSTISEPSPAEENDRTATIDLPDAASSAYPTWISFLTLFTIIAFVPLAILYGSSIGPWIIPCVVVLLLGFGAAKRVRVYEVFVEGAKDGFNVAIKIIPYLIAILVAVAMFRESGAMHALVYAVGSITSQFGFPGEALPMALLRPLSGSGAYGVLAATLQDPATGPDTYVGYLVSTLQGSTETTFYVLAVYFGSVQVRRIRHALAAGLTADLVGIIAATASCYYLYG
jgi:spore maturation protein SpmB